MATQDSVFVPSSPEDLTGTVNSSSSSSAITLGSRRIIAINATQDIMVNFGGSSGVAAATASNFRIPANIVAEYDTGDYAGFLRIWNNGASTATYWIQFLAKS